LKLGPADPVVDGQILHRLHVKRDAGNFREFGLHPPDDIGGASRALVERFQIDLNASAVQRCICSVDPMKDERLSTAGSFKSVFTTLCCKRDISLNETDCEASVTP